MAPTPKRRKLSNGDSAPSEQVLSAETSTEAGVAVSEKNSKEQRRSLFVRSLPTSVTSERLAEHFSQSSPIKHATVVIDKATGVSRGFGFVTFTDADGASNAVNELNNSSLDGRKIKVELAESRSRDVAEDFATGRAKGGVNKKGQELRAERQQRQQDNRPPKLIIRNLPWSIKTSNDLTKLFLAYGKVKHAVVPSLPQKTKGGTQSQAGFGIVILRGKKNAERALEGVNGKEVDGRVLAVDWAVDKETWEKVKEGQNETTNGDDGDQILGEDNLEPEAGKKVAKDKNSAMGIDLDSASDQESPDLEDVDSELLPSGSDMDDEEHRINSDDDASLDDETETETTSLTATKNDENNTTVFIRNLPFTADDDSLYEHFKANFGPVHYSRVVYDHDTERSRGTAFVSFYSEDIARECVKNAPKHESSAGTNDKPERKRNGQSHTHSLLQNEMNDPSGKYTLEGRVLQVTRALPKADADRRAEESSQKRSENKRRLYLLSEGTIPKGSQLYNLLGKAEIDIRESSSRQRQKLVKQNPNLGLSLSRLSIRNIPRSVSSKDLKALAREAVVGFAKDVKDGKRQPLNKEELLRGGDEDREAERQRKEKGKGIVKQVKIVFESEKTGGKVGEGKGGRSRGYGFIEYYGHRHALMGLRWLNGHLVKATGGDGAERNKRLIVEFAIENAQVVQRRADREKRVRDGGFEGDGSRGSNDRKRKRDESDQATTETTDPAKRKRSKGQPSKASSAINSSVKQDEKNKVAARNRIIAQKRHKRKTRKGKS